MTSMTIPAGGDDDVLLERQLVLALSAGSRAVFGACTRVLQDLNLTQPQHLVTLSLWEKNPSSPREVDDLLPEPGSL